MKQRHHFLRLSLRRSLGTLVFVMAAQHAGAVTYYKSNNVLNMNQNASWEDVSGAPLATTPANSTSSSDVLIWDNRVTAANTVDLGDNIGIRTVRILNPGGPVGIVGSGKTLTVTSGGGIDMSAATQDLTVGSSNFFRVASSNANIAFDVAAGRTLTMNADVTVRNNSSGVNVTFPGAGTSIFTGSFNPSNVTISDGLVQFNNPAGTSRLSTHATTVNGGRLMVNNTTGSATGSGPVAVNSGGTLGGQGIISGTVTAASGATLSPGNNAIGSLTVGSLNLAAGSKLDWEITDSANADVINVTANNGLTIDGGTINLYQPGTTTPFAGLGDFSLFNYTGSIAGGGIGTLAVSEATKVAGHNYSFALSAGVVQLRITSGAITKTFWNVNSNGNWSTGSNWTGGTAPDAVGAHASFGGGGTPITAPRTVTVDGRRTVSSVTFDSAQPFTLAGSGPLTLNDGSFAAKIAVKSGSHVIQTPVDIMSGGGHVTVDPGATLRIQGDLDDAGLGLTKAGEGTLILSGANFGYLGTTSIGAGTLQIGADGTTGEVLGAIANSGLLRYKRSDYTFINGLISGTGDLEQAGTGELEIAYANTFSGTTTITSGSLLLNAANGLQRSTLHYPGTSGPIRYGAFIGSVTLGGLTGNGALPLTDMDGQPVALQVGGNNQSTTYSGSPVGIGTGFTKAGTGTLTLSGAHTYSGDTNISGGVLKIDTGGNFQTAAANLATTAGAKLLVSGGTLTSSASSLVTNASDGIEVSGGTANFNGGITTQINVASGTSRIVATGGTLNAASIRLGRSSLNFGTAEPAAGQANGGLYVNGGQVNVTGSLNIGNGENSSASTRIDAGGLTVNGQLLLGIASPDRWSVLDVNGGTLTSTDATSGVVLGGTAAGQVAMLIRNAAAVARAERIQFGQTDLAGQSYLNLSAGALYVGGGGLVLGSTNPSFTGALRLSGGVLGATADSVSSVPVVLTGDAVVTAADAANVPHTMTLGGKISGTGTLTKSGAGTLVLTGANTHTGTTQVTGGVLAVSGNSIDDGSTLAITTGKVRPLANETVGTLTLGGVQQPNGTYGAVGSGAQNQNDTYFTGTAGVITVGTGTAGSYAAWAAVNAPGQTPGQDFNQNGLANGVEYFMGLSGNSQPPNVGPVAGKLTWPKNPGYLGTFTIQTSTTLLPGSWTDVPVNGVNPKDNGTSLEFTPPTGQGKIFTRLRVVPN